MYEREFKILKKAILYVGKHIFAKGASERKTKGNFDYVTDKDIACEKYLIDTIKKYFSNDNIVSEESNFQNDLKDRSWIIDPIDGTLNYMNGLKNCCVQLAFYAEGQSQFSFVYLPFKNDFYYAIKGKGAYLNGKKLIASKVKIQECVMAVCVTKHDNSLILTHNLLFALRNQILTERILGSYGCATAMTAAGNIGIFADISPHINLWDCMPGELICQEAGLELVRDEYKGYDYSVISNSQEINNIVIKEIKDQIDLIN